MSNTLGTGMANHTTEPISVLPRRIVTIATLYSPYLYNETMTIGEMRLHGCDRSTYKTSA